ncbi:MAG TPA: hypothetical protein VNT22_03655 [Baekduia sp.]|nr:hypothetical protein [Baekduia sp.]
MSEDAEHAISYQALKRGTPVRSADGVELGKVRRVDEAQREHIFDGIVIDTPGGKRFVDAPEVERITTASVTVTFTAAEADDHYQQVSSRMPGALAARRLSRRAKRMTDSAKNTWDRR